MTMSFGANIFLSIENGHFLKMAKSLAHDDFSEAPQRADSKTAIFLFLPNFGSGSPPGPGGSVSVGFGGGGRQLSPFGPP